mmetsp:Transcript_30737/g.70331  ORF Transcript_30737/g.70331 Transcript_30737/m.70331 type:complete len:239 (+) Transcript_30737:274-990(+)
MSLVTWSPKCSHTLLICRFFPSVQVILSHALVPPPLLFFEDDSKFRRSNLTSIPFIRSCPTIRRLLRSSFFPFLAFIFFLLYVLSNQLYFFLPSLASAQAYRGIVTPRLMARIFSNVNKPQTLTLYVLHSCDFGLSISLAYIPSSVRTIRPSVLKSSRPIGLNATFSDKEERSRGRRHRRGFRTRSSPSVSPPKLRGPSDSATSSPRILFASHTLGSRFTLPFPENPNMEGSKCTRFP